MRRGFLQPKKGAAKHIHKGSGQKSTELFCHTLKGEKVPTGKLAYGYLTEEEKALPGDYDAKNRNPPLDLNVKLEPNKENGETNRSNTYASLIGSLQYLATATRSDIAYGS